MSDNSVIGWLLARSNWVDTSSQTGILTQTVRHLEYSAIGLAIGAAIAIPLGLYIGHTGKAAKLITVANGLRSLPSFGILILVYVVLAPAFHGPGNLVFLLPTEVILVLLAVPPMLANTAAGIQQIDPSIRDAARGMGMTESQVLWQAEVPNAAPLMFAGFRSASLQVIATATIAAYMGLGGLGRFIFDGLAISDSSQLLAGATLVAVLSIVVDLLLGVIQRYATSRGVSGRFETESKSRSRPAAPAPSPESLVTGR